MAIDLSTLPTPTIFEVLSYEDTLARKLASFQARNPDYELLTEADPAVLALEGAAYDEMDLISRVNSSFQQIFISLATGSNLDNLAAVIGLPRLVLVEEDLTANPPVAQVLESDEDFRARIILGISALSPAGPEEYYELKAKNAGGDDVEDISVTRPIRGTVRIAVLASNDTGIPDDDLLETIDDAVQASDVRCFNDVVEVVAAAATTFAITADVKLRDDAPQSVFDGLEDLMMEKYLERRGLGVDITKSWVASILQQSGVYSVTVSSPASDVVVDGTHFAKLTAITLTQGDSDI